MKILKYDTKEETLYVTYNTLVVWTYKYITKDMYKELLDIEQAQEKLFHSIVRKNNIVGTIEEDNNDINS